MIDNTPQLKAHRWYMFTLSEPNCTDLAAGLKSLTSAFRRLRQRSYWADRCFGGAYVFEVTGTPGNWHPHIHGVVYARYVDYNRMIKLWRKVSKGSACWFDRIPAKEAAKYCTKYFTKPDVPDALLDDINEGLKGLRWFSAFGGCHSIRKVEPKYEAHCPDCQGGLHVLDFRPDFTNPSKYLAYLARQKNGIPTEIITARVLDREQARQRSLSI